MEDMFRIQFYSNLLGNGIDWTVLTAFLIFCLVAFLSPVVGYEPRRPRGISASLYLLIAYMVIGIMYYIVQWYGYYDQVGGNNTSRPGRGDRGDSSTTTVYFFVFSIVKLVIFVAAMLSFASGVLSLRVQKILTPDWSKKNE